MSNPLITQEFTVFSKQIIADLHLKPKEIFLNTSMFYITGHLQGTIEDLKYKPNSKFHTPSQVSINEKACVLSYQEEGKAIDMDLSLFEIYEVIHAYYDAYLTKAEEQRLFLYPGIEAFALDDNRNLVIRMVNIHPKDQHLSDQALSVKAFMCLLEKCHPKIWKRINQKHKNIYHIPHLLEALEYHPFSFLSFFGSFFRHTLVIVMMLMILIWGMLIFGPKAQVIQMKQVYQSYIVAPLKAFFLEEDQSLARNEDVKHQALLYQIDIDESMTNEEMLRFLGALIEVLQDGDQVFGAGYEIGIQSSVMKNVELVDMAYYQKNWDLHCGGQKRICQEIVIYLPRCQSMKKAIKSLSALYSQEEVFELKTQEIEIVSKIKLSKLLKK